jgi:diketogulonate reductase-like aldo/keto reductase
VDRPKYLEYCKNKGIHVTAYSCLGSTDSPLYRDEELKALAAAKGRTVQQVLYASPPLRWCSELIGKQVVVGPTARH